MYLCLENYLKKLPNWRYRIKTEEKKKSKETPDPTNNFVYIYIANFLLMAYFFPKNSLNDFAFFWLQIKKYNQSLTESTKNTTWLLENCILLFCIERNNFLGVTESQIGSYVLLQFLVYMKINQYHVHKTLTPSISTKLNSPLSNS